MKGLNQFIRNTFPEVVLDYFDLLLILTVALLILKKYGVEYYFQLRQRRILKKWNTSPKDVVILHSTARGPTVPAVSPFGLKLETYLRMAKIPYQFDDEFPLGKKGKTPWITLNGQHLADSQLVIQALAKRVEKFDVTFGSYNETEQAYAKAARVMTEEHLYWCGVVWRFTYCDPEVVSNLYAPVFKKLPRVVRSFMWKNLVSKFRNMAWSQGTARHSYNEIVELMTDSMSALSRIIGDKQYLLGDEPTEDDAGVFGLLAQALWASPGPFFEDIFNRFPNLKAYTIRMRHRYWPDWDDLLGKA